MLLLVLYDFIIGSNGTEASPNNKGFEYFYGYTSQENAHDYYPPFLWHLLIETSGDICQQKSIS